MNKYREVEEQKEPCEERRRRHLSPASSTWVTWGQTPDTKGTCTRQQATSNNSTRDTTWTPRASGSTLAHGSRRLTAARGAPRAAGVVGRMPFEGKLKRPGRLDRGRSLRASTQLSPPPHHSPLPSIDSQARSHRCRAKFPFVLASDPARPATLLRQLNPELYFATIAFITQLLQKG